MIRLPLSSLAKCLHGGGEPSASQDSSEPRPTLRDRAGNRRLQKTEIRLEFKAALAFALFAHFA